MDVAFEAVEKLLHISTLGFCFSVFFHFSSWRSGWMGRGGKRILSAFGSGWVNCERG